MQKIKTKSKTLKKKTKKKNWELKKRLLRRDQTTSNPAIRKSHSRLKHDLHGLHQIRHVLWRLEYVECRQCLRILPFKASFVRVEAKTSRGCRDDRIPCKHQYQQTMPWWFVCWNQVPWCPFEQRSVPCAAVQCHTKMPCNTIKFYTNHSSRHLFAHVICCNTIRHATPFPMKYNRHVSCWRRRLPQHNTTRLDATQTIHTRRHCTPVVDELVTPTSQ